MLIYYYKMFLPSLLIDFSKSRLNSFISILELPEEPKSLK